MIGIGTLVNTATIVAGGLCGLLFGQFLTQRIRDTLMNAVGISVLFLGIVGAMEQMLMVQEGKLVAGNSIMLTCCLALGGVLGEFLNLEGALERFGLWLKKVSRSEGENSFVDGFLTATFTVCIGAMAVVGALQDGMGNGYSILLTKALLDFLSVMVMSASQGKGCIFSAVPVLIFQGTITLFAGMVAPVVTPAAQTNLSMVGSVLIFCVGLNLVWGKKVRVANLLPALILAVLWAFLPL